MVAAFDFDGVLSSERIQMLAKKMIRENNEVWVVTARGDNEFNRNIVREVLGKIKLSEFRVMFCGRKPKIDYLKIINADIFIENNSDEFENINNLTNTIPLIYAD